MILKQFYLGCLAHASYFIADEETKIAAVIDPQRDIDQYLEEAKTQGWKIRYVFLTHFHADFLAGHLELRDSTGAEICLGAQAQAQFPFKPMRDDETLEFGRVRLRILETPGHTPEAISIVVYDLAQSETTPHAVLTGDTLFIGDVGRPDLMASVGISAEELAGQLYESLHHKLLALPNDTLVYPAHGAGSLCGKHLSSDTVSTIGTQRWYNYALQPMRKEEFVQLVTSHQPEVPPYFSYDAMLNKEEHETLDQAIQRGLTPLSLEEVLQCQRQWAQVVDVREPAQFAGGHLVGSMNIGLNGKFATWAGIVLDQDTDIVLIANRGREREAIMRLGRIGFDQVSGYLLNGMEALESRKDLVHRIKRMTAGNLAEQLRTSHPPGVLDVRTEREREEGQIETSLNIPLPHLRKRIHELSRDKELVVYCASGYRSSIAVSLLKHAGFSKVMDLVGGYEAWEKTWGKQTGRLEKTEAATVNS